MRVGCLAVALAALLCLAAAVDRSNFKTCKDSSFCRRHRALEAGNSQYSVVAGSIEATDNQATFDVVNSHNGVTLAVKVTVVGEGTARVHINEKNPLHPRYEVENVLPANLENLPFASVDKEASAVVIKFGVNNTVVVHHNPFTVDVLHNGQPSVRLNSRGLLHFEHYRESKSENDEDGMWEESFKSHADSKPRGPASVGIDISFPSVEHVYGIPEHSADLALKPTRGDGIDSDPYRLYNLDVFEYELENPMALYGSIPFMVAHSAQRTSGAFFMNSAEMWIDVAKGKTSAGLNGMLRRLQSLFAKPQAEEAPQTDTHWFAESGVIDLFLMVGPQPKDVLRQYTSLTGTTPLPPLFSLAYHQCRWNYNDEQDVQTVETQMDEHDIPFDVLWLDIEHSDGKRWMTWDKAKFPTPIEMQNRLAEKGRKMVNIIDPHIKRAGGYHIHEEATQLGHYVKNKDGNDYEGWCWPGSSSWLDFMNPAVQSWWADQISLDKYQGTTHSMFFWNDMNEPSVFNGPEVTMHKDAKHFGGWEHRDVHNIYGMWQQAATGEGIRRRSGVRPFVLSRAFFAGSQKYGAIWTGDNAADWGHLKASMPMLQSIGLAGLPFIGADMGGFFKNPETELLVRWYQVGAFQPFMRAHAHLDTRRREPYLYDEADRELMRAAVRSRYQHLPFWYTQFYQTSINGSPIMRPLWFNYPEDQQTFEIQNNYLVGSDLLVAPAIAAGERQVNVYFPGSEPWYDVQTYQTFSGPASKSVAAPLRKIPVFQRGGSIVPKKMRVRRSSSLTHSDPFTLVATLDSTGAASGLLYVDDYYSFKKDQGQFAVRQFSVKTTSNGLDFSSRAAPESGSWDTKEWVEKLIIAGVHSRPRLVQDGQGNELGFTFSDANKVLTIKKPAGSIVQDFDVKVTL